MWRAWIGWGVLLLGPVAAWSAEERQQVTLSITIARGAADKLGSEAEGVAMAAAIERLQQAGELTGLTRIRFTTLSEVESHFQFGASEYIVAGLKFPPGFNPGQRGGAANAASYVRDESGTQVRVTTHVTDEGVLAKLSIEQSQFDRSPTAGADAASLPPPTKSVLALNSTVAIPKEGVVVVGEFLTIGEAHSIVRLSGLLPVAAPKEGIPQDGGVVAGGPDSIARGPGQRTVILVSASVGATIPLADKADPVRQLQIYSLQKLDPKAAQQLLEELFDDKDIKIVVDQKANRLCVHATAEQCAQVEALLRELDK